MAVDAANRYDFSEYPLDHPLYDTSNRKALGFFKDELNSIPMREFVGLRSKCYAFHCTGEVKNNVVQHDRSTEKKTAKGVKWKVTGEHYLNTLLERFSHYLNTLHIFESYVCKQNFQPSQCSYSLLT